MDDNIPGPIKAACYREVSAIVGEFVICRRFHCISFMHFLYLFIFCQLQSKKVCIQ